MSREGAKAQETDVVRVALLQVSGAWEDPPESRRQAASWIASAAAAGARLVLLPEMFPCGFGSRAHRFAEAPGGATERFLATKAREHDLYVGGSIAELAPGAERPSNTLLLAGPGGEVRRYAKRHLFSPAGEDERFTPGTATPTWTLDGLRCTPAICYDLRFPARFWEAASGTDCFLVVASWPAARRAHWKTLLRARAIESQAYVCAVNRVGEGGGVAYAGDSAVIGPEGEILVTAAEDETILLFDLSPARVREARARFPFVSGRFSSHPLT